MRVNNLMISEALSAYSKERHPARGAPFAEAGIRNHRKAMKSAIKAAMAVKDVEFFQSPNKTQSAKP